MISHKTSKATPSERQLSMAIGHRIKVARMTRRISQEALAAGVEISFQQLQKIERGENRCSAARLVLIAAFLRCSAIELLPASADGRADPAPADLIVVNPTQLLLINDLNVMSRPQRSKVYALARTLVGRKGAPNADGSLKVLARVAETADA